MFGYDIGISGGVTSMDDFLLKFFPAAVYEKKHKTKENNYCNFDDKFLELFTSAAAVCSWIASMCCKKYGWGCTMQMAAVFFLIGVVLKTASADIYMLFACRILLGASDLETRRCSCSYRKSYQMKRLVSYI